MRVYLDDLPDWMSNGTQIKEFREVCGDEPFDVKSHLFKENDVINNIEDFKQVFSICRYWGIAFPDSIYNYTDVDEVLEYLLPFRSQMEVKELIEEFKNSLTLSSSIHRRCLLVVKDSDSAACASFCGITIDINFGNNKMTFTIFENETKDKLSRISICIRDKIKEKINLRHDPLYIEHDSISYNNFIIPLTSRKREQLSKYFGGLYEYYQDVRLSLKDKEINYIMEQCCFSREESIEKLVSHYNHTSSVVARESPFKITYSNYLNGDTYGIPKEWFNVLFNSVVPTTMLVSRETYDSIYRLVHHKMKDYTFQGTLSDTINHLDSIIPDNGEFFMF